jgi:hypothetical protein
MALVDTRVTTWQALSAEKVTPRFRGDTGKVVRASNMKRRSGMARTAKLECFSHVAIFVEYFNDLTPHWHMGIGVGIANDVHPVLCPR